MLAIKASQKTEVELKEEAEKGDISSIVQLGLMYEKGEGAEINYAAAIYCFKRAIQKSSELPKDELTKNILGFIQYRLAHMYENITGTEKKGFVAYSEALYWYEKALENKDGLNREIIGNVLCRTAYMYEHGIGTEQNYIKATELYEMAIEKGNQEAINSLKPIEDLEKDADNGNTMAILRLGYIYESGYGIDYEDPGKAIYYFKKAAEKEKGLKNQILSLLNFKLGCIYENGKGIERNFQQARYWYEKALFHQDIFKKETLGLLLYKLGNLYENSFEIEKNYFKAIEFYKRSLEVGYTKAEEYLKTKDLYEEDAAKGNPEAMIRLGYMYENGYGVTKNYKEAIYYFEEAVKTKKLEDKTLSLINYKLGQMYETGLGVKQDYGKAREFYKQASILGNKEALINLKTEDELKEDAENGDVLAIVKLGYMYEISMDIENHEIKAAYCFKRAIQKNSLPIETLSLIQFKLGFMYENGCGVDQNFKESLYWYKQAENTGNYEAKEALNRLKEQNQSFSRKQSSLIFVNENIKFPWDIDEEDQNDSEYEIEYINLIKEDFNILDQKQHSIAVFYQNNIDFLMTIKSKSLAFTGKYSGILGGLYAKPNGLGSFEFKENEDGHGHEMFFSGTWDNGYWQKGEFREIIKKSNLEVSIYIASGYFEEGKLCSVYEGGNAHIKAIKTLLNGKKLEINCYGQIKEDETSFHIEPIKYLKNFSISKGFYFHNENNLIGQLKVIDLMNVKNNYQIIGFWKFDNGNQKLQNVVRNDFESEIKSLINEIKKNIEKMILKTSVDSRYAIYGFYKIINKNSYNLKKFLDALLTEKDKYIVPDQIKDLAKRLKDVIEFSEETDNFVDTERDDKVVDDYRELIENYLSKNYLEWLKKDGKYDSEHLNAIQNNYEAILFIDPNILEMFSFIRQQIKDHWNVSPFFELVLYSTDPNDLKLTKEAFMDSWGRYFQSATEVKRLLHALYNFDDKIDNYKGGYNSFIERIDEINKVNTLYKKYFRESLSVLIKKDEAYKGKNEEFKELCTKFHENYLSIINSNFHLERDGRLVDYEQRYKKIIKNQIDIFMNKYIEEIPNFEIKEIVKKTSDLFAHDARLSNIQYILNMFEYLLKIKKLINSTDQIVIEIIKKQINVFCLMNDIESIDPIKRATQIFSEFLEAYLGVNQDIKNKIGDHFSSVLQGINNSLFQHFSFVLSGIENDMNETKITNACDFFRKQIGFLKNTKNLALFVKKIENNIEFNKLLDKHYDEKGEQGVYKINNDDKCKIKKLISDIKFLKISIPSYYSYEILKEVLEKLSSLLEKYAESSFDQQVTMLDNYYDLFGELIKSLDKQLNYNDLDNYKRKRLEIFNACESMTSIDRVINYINVLKRQLSVQGNQKEIDPKKAIQGFVLLNQHKPYSEELLLSLYNKYLNKFRQFKTRYSSDPISINDIFLHLESILSDDQKSIASSSKGSDWDLDIIYKKNNAKENLLTLLAGISWILTVRVSKMDDKEGRCSKDFNIELSPHVIQILGCIQFLALDQDLEQKKIIGWLNNVPKQVGEILTGQGKSWQISLLSMIYMLAGYEVIVACYSDYLSKRDQEDFNNNFKFVDKERLNKVKFNTLNDLACNQIEGNFPVDEKIASLVKQIIYNKEYSGEVNANFDQKSYQSILIIDEVDTLISSELGNGVHRISRVYSEYLAQAIEDLYTIAKNKDIITPSSDSFRRFEETAKKDPKIQNLHPDLFDKIKKEILNCTNNVANYYSNDSDRKAIGEKLFIDWGFLTSDYRLNFRLSDDGKGVEYYYQDRWNPKLFTSYYNGIFYLELFSQQHKFEEKNFESYGFVTLSCGSIYYSATVSNIINQSYNNLLGVTGSIKQRKDNQFLLSDAEKDILGDSFLGVKEDKINYFPSFYGETRVTFKPDRKEYFTIIGGKEKWIETIIEKIVELSNQGKAVLIFLKNESNVEQIFLQLINKHKEPYKLTNDEISVDANGIRKSDISKSYDRKTLGDNWSSSVERLVGDFCAGEAGAITLAIHSYGRGTDFKCSGPANQNGGLHVIQTWFSEDPKEEVQIRGRTARNGSPGVYMQVICLDHLKTEFHKDIDQNDIDLNITYYSLREKAMKSMQQKYSELKGNIQAKEKESRTALDWLYKVRQDRNKKLVHKEPTNIEQALIEDYYTNIYKLKLTS